MVTKIEVCYYAKCPDTGEIWECKDFKTLYHCVCFSFNCDLHNGLYYDFRSAILSYGVCIHFDDNTCEYKSIKDLGFICASVMDRKVHRAHWYN